MVCGVKFITETKSFDGTTMKKKINVIKDRNHSSRNIVHVKKLLSLVESWEREQFYIIFFFYVIAWKIII